MTGAGKSSFIAAASGLRVKVGHTLDPCTNTKSFWCPSSLLTNVGTTEIQTHDMDCQNGTQVSLIDTPGFNDLRMSDMDVLQSILTFLDQASVKQKIVAVLYLHRIVDKKITGSSEMNLRMLQAICGEHFFQNVGLVTSMWASISADGQIAAAEREQELNSADGGFWGDMCRKGAKYERWDEKVGNHFTPARQIVERWVEAYRIRPTTAKLQVLLELEKGLATEETTAGKILTVEIRKRQEKELRRLQEEEEERRLLEEETRALRERMQQAQDGIKREAELAGSQYRRNDRHHGGLNSLLPDALVGRSRVVADASDESDEQYRREAPPPRNRRRSSDDYRDNSRSSRTSRNSRQRHDGYSSRSYSFWRGW